MTQDQYYNLQIEDVIYNKKTNIVVVLRSCFIPNKERLEHDSISAEILGKEHSYYAVNAKQCTDWEYVSENSPLEVKHEVLVQRVFRLEQFVHSRLH